MRPLSVSIKRVSFTGGGDRPFFDLASRRRVVKTTAGSDLSPVFRCVCVRTCTQAHCALPATVRTHVRMCTHVQS